MGGHNMYAFSFNELYKLYVAKIERKNRTIGELMAVISWLTGYEKEELQAMDDGVDLERFFQSAPCLNPKRHAIKGSICGVNIQKIQDPMMKEIRYMDKLVDELAKGKALEKILPDSI